MTNFEQILYLWIVQERFGIFAGGEFDDDHSLRCPIALNWCRRNSLNDILSGVLGNMRGDLSDVAAEPGKISY